MGCNRLHHLVMGCAPITFVWRCTLVCDASSGTLLAVSIVCGAPLSSGLSGIGHSECRAGLRPAVIDHAFPPVDVLLVFIQLLPRALSGASRTDRLSV
jgi:hypothetical protein